MTAEIAIMNKEAVALAADSAVTMGGETGQKIFTSANKLFALSKYHPVGVMLYGNALFMDVPWETIIKTYRNALDERAFATLKEYANDLIRFLDKGNSLFPGSVQEQFVRSSIQAYFDFLIGIIKDKVQSILNEKGEIGDKEIRLLISGVVQEHYDTWEQADIVSSLPKTHTKSVSEEYTAIIDEVINEAFEQLPLSGLDSRRLKKIAASLFSKLPEAFEQQITSGLVVAGFGKEDTFPSLQSFQIEGIASNRLKYRERGSQTISFETSAAIIPFAQREMVATFMEGVDPSLWSHLMGYLSEIFSGYPEVIVDNIEEFDNEQKEALRSKLKEVNSRVFQDYQENVTNYRRISYVDPVLNFVAMLPKDELAAMAESLVNLTSFKRKVTMESETVGGPIDVAVISKGDGFIWIKRKHYFRAELNPQFFANYYREAPYGEE